MFTIKASYRGQTRKHTFSDNTFPSYDQICVQLYRVFPIEHDFYLTKVLFSPDANVPSRILLSREIRSGAAYDRCIAQFHQRTWRNALLRFYVHDVESNSGSRTPTMASTTMQDDASNVSIQSQHTHPLYTPLYLPTNPNLSDADFEMNDAAHSTPDRTPAQSGSAIPQRQTPSVTSKDSCCSVSHGKAEVKALLTDFQQNLNRVMEDNFGSPFVSAEAASFSQEDSSKAPSAPPPSLCSVCTKNITGQGEPSYSCDNCHIVLCGECNRSTRPGFCLNTMSNHVMKPVSSQGGHPIPHLPLWTPGSSASGAAAQQPQDQSSATPASSEPTVHHRVWCDVCNQTIIGVRHKCLDCLDYDLCTPCIQGGGAESHNPFHEFYEITQPGRVIVHTVFSGNGERDTRRRRGRRQNAEASPAAQEQPVTHLARCNLCDSRIQGTRYKCLDCPDFDTCSACFSITPEQHPHHSFVKITNRDDHIRRHQAGTQHQMHYATCNACLKAIYGVRFKCMHPECPDFDLCQVCEAHPIPQHPALHPILKIKTPETAIPTVYRVGRTQLIPTPDERDGVKVPEARSPSPVEDSVRSSTPKPRSTEPTPTTPPHSQPVKFGPPTPLKPLGCTMPVNPMLIVPPPPPPPPMTLAAVPVPQPQLVAPLPPLPPKPEMMSQSAWASIPSLFIPTPVSIPAEPMVRDNSNNPFADPVELKHVTDGLRPTPIRSASPVRLGMNPWPTTNPAEKDELLKLIDEFSFKEKKEDEAEKSVEEMRTEFIGKFPKLDGDEALSRTMSPWARWTQNVHHLLEDIGDEPATTDKPTSPIRAMTNPFSTRAPSIADSERSLSLLKEPVASESKISSSNDEEGVATTTANGKGKNKALSLADIMNEIQDIYSSTLASAVPPPAKAVALESPGLLSAGFIEDVTVPDGQAFPPGAEFMKCWKLVNDGGREWPENTELVFVAGETLVAETRGKAAVSGIIVGGEGDLQGKMLPKVASVSVGSVRPGAEVDVWSCELKAPEVVGRYVGYWRLRAGGDGEVFGCSLWIDINVVESDSAHSSDESIAASSVIIMPTPSSHQGTIALPPTTQASSTATGTSASTMDGEDDGLSDDSSISVISAPDSDMELELEDEEMWHDSRSHLTSTVATPSAASPGVRSAGAAGGDFVLLYDERSSSGEE